MVLISRCTSSTEPRNQDRWLSGYVFCDLAAKRPKINLSWGINERESRPLSNTESQLGESIPTFPTTITNKPSPELENHNNVKVLTDTSE